MPTILQAIRGEAREVPPENKVLSVCGKEEFLQLKPLVQQETGLDLQHDTLQKLPSLDASPDKPLAQMLQTRMLYFCLVDADYSATSEYYEKDYLQKTSGEPLQPQKLLKRLQKHRDAIRASSTSDKKLNAMRDNLYESCIQAAEQSPGLFTLTAPTGMGKTLDLLAFALVHAAKWGKSEFLLCFHIFLLLNKMQRGTAALYPECSKATAR